MIGLLAGAARRTVETVYGWRRFEFGPPTGDYSSHASLITEVSWHRYGAYVAWHPDESAVVIDGCVGPLGWALSVARPKRVPELREPLAELLQFVFEAAGRRVHVGMVQRHVGAVVSWARLSGGVEVDAKVGPVGVHVEPAVS